MKETERYGSRGRKGMNQRDGKVWIKVTERYESRRRKAMDQEDEKV